MSSSPRSDVDRPLWACPECGRSFANANQWHACQDTSVDEYLAGKTELAIAIFDTVVGALGSAGDFRIHPQKTRIAFISRMTFGGMSLARKWADLAFILPEPLDDDRVRRLTLYGPTSWGHGIRLHEPEDVESDVRQWLAEALRRGDQETLDPHREVRPLIGRQLDVFWTGIRAKVKDGLVALPGHVSQALALVDTVSAKMAGKSYLTDLVRDGASTFVAVDPSTRLGEGDDVDVYLKASG